MRAVTKLTYFLFGLALAAGTSMAADAVPTPRPPSPGYVVPLPYPGVYYTIPYFRPLVQNPYLPAFVPTPQAMPPYTAYPWPFFMMLPQLSAPPSATMVPSPGPVAPAPDSPVPVTSTPVTTTPVTATPDATAEPPQLTQEAQKALAQAEADVRAARASFTLWVPAENALIAAKEAAKAGDDSTVLKQAKVVADLTRLGVDQAQYPTTEVPPELLEEAKKALAQAEADVQVARADFTLWVPAENAFKAAQEAAKAGDSGTVIKLAREIAELTRLGAEQAQYPSTEAPAKPVAKRKAKPKARIKRAAPKPTTVPKPTVVPSAKKSQAAASGTTAVAKTPTKAVPPASAGSKPAAVGNTIMPRKLCWQGDRLVECP